MAFIVYTDSDEPFRFDGKIAGNQKRFLLKDANGTRIYETDKIQAIMREDFSESYKAEMDELVKLKFGDPEDN